MQGPLVDIVVLGLLVVLFGLQQRNRPNLIYRFWFAGWVFVFCSLAAWEYKPADAFLVQVQDAVRLNLLFLAGMAFLVSFVAKPGRVLRSVGLGLIVCVPVWVMIALQHLVAMPYWLVAAMIVLGESAAVSVTLLLPRRWRRRRLWIAGACVASGVWMLTLTAMGGRADLEEWILTQLFLCTALLYAGGSAQRTVGRLVGSAGFVTWGVCYALSTELTAHPWALRTLYEMWNVPKYAVAFGMILTIFEETSRESAVLSEDYRLLYEDFRLLYENHPHPMWVYDPATLHFISANLAASAIYGYSLDEFKAMQIQDLEVPREKNAAGLAAEAGMVDVNAKVARHRRKDRSEISVELSDRAIVFRGQQARFVLAVDITERERLNQELVYRAQHDSLTGLPNRLMLEDRMLECLARSTRDQKKAVLFTIDADRFKLINDTYGHLIGDECLKSIASRLRTRIRQIDIIARTGGEEFTAVIGGLKSEADAVKIADSLLRLFDEPVRLPGLDVPLTISIGGAIFPDDAYDMDALRRKSDQALYRAKRGGRNRAVFASMEGAVGLREAMADDAESVA